MFLRLAAMLLSSSVLAAEPTYAVELTAMGPNKIQVIKVVKDRTGLGLKDSKDLVESAPKIVKTNLDRAAADALHAQLTTAGATAKILDNGVAVAPAAKAPGMSVTLVSCGAKKIEVIKIIREVTGVSLKEARDLAEQTPSMIKFGLPAADAEALQKRLEAAGATAKVGADAP